MEQAEAADAENPTVLSARRIDRENAGITADAAAVSGPSARAGERRSRRNEMKTASSRGSVDAIQDI